MSVMANRLARRSKRCYNIHPPVWCNPFTPDRSRYMKLDVTIEEQTYPIEIPATLLDEAEDFFRKMDSDMDRGWQMGTEFVEQPNALQRCQIAANKLVTSHATENTLLVQLMAAYILKRQPGVTGVMIDTLGDPQGTELVFGQERKRIATPSRQILSETEARTKADKDVSPAYKVGRVWRFAVYDESQDRWLESPPTETEAEAREQPERAHAQMLRHLQGLPTH